MKYKKLAVVISSVIMFVGCNDPQIFKRLEETQAKLKSTEAKLASLQYKYDQMQANANRAERTSNALAEKNESLLLYKHKRESEDALARIKEAKGADVEKLTGTWRGEYGENQYTSKPSHEIKIVISRPRDFYGPLKTSDMDVKIWTVQKGFPSSGRWETGFTISSIAPGHIRMVRDQKKYYSNLGTHSYIQEYQIKFLTPQEAYIWNPRSKDQWGVDENGEHTQVKLEK